jgi:hypothetical protein
MTDETVTRCTFALRGDGKGGLVECGAPIVDHWMESVKCVDGHWTRGRVSHTVTEIEDQTQTEETSHD